MKRLFSYDSPLITFLNAVADVIFVNLLYVVCCLPIFTIGAAHTALYTVAIKWCEKENAGVKEFLTAFGKNFKTSVPLWLTILPITLFFAFDIYLMILNEFPAEWVLWVLLAPLAFLFVYGMSHLFMVEARFICSYRQALKNSVLLSFGHPFCSLVNVALTAFPLVVFGTNPLLFFETGPFWFLCYFSLWGYVSAGIAKRPYERLIQRMKEAEAEQAAEAAETAAIQPPQEENV